MKPLLSPLHPPNCHESQNNRDVMKMSLQEDPSLLKVSSKCVFGCVCMPLMSAVRMGHYECVSILLQAGALPDMSYDTLNESCRETPLQVAITERRHDIVRLLLYYGASSTCSVERINYVTMAAMTGQVYTLRLLLEHGAQIDISFDDPRNLTPAQIAIRHNEDESLRILLLFGAQIQNDTTNYSLLHHVIQSSRFQTKRWEKKKRMMELLRDFGADLWQKNESGLTVFDVINDPQFPKLPAVELNKALSDVFSNPNSLQNLSRLAIVKCIGRDRYLKSIPSLDPLPPLVKALLYFS